MIIQNSNKTYYHKVNGYVFRKFVKNKIESMDHIMPQIDLSKDRVRIAQSFDIAKMQKEVKKLNFQTFLYYDVIPLRSPAYMVDPSFPIPLPVDDYADGSWTEWLDTKALNESPYLQHVVDFFGQNTKVTLVRLLRLEAGSIIKEHCDPTLGLQIQKSVIRFTVPVISHEEVKFYLNGTPVPMKTGQCWYLRLTDPHSVVNGSDQERINMTIDMLPNDWVKSIIAEGIKKYD